MSKKKKKNCLVVLIQLLIVAGFLIGADWASRDVYVIYQSYYADFSLPFGFYFLLSLKRIKINFFNIWWKKALAIFLLVATSETLQYFDIYALARVFDPLDYVVYGAGVLLAAFVDRKIFNNSVSFWV